MVTTMEIYMTETRMIPERSYMWAATLYVVFEVLWSVDDADVLNGMQQRIEDAYVSVAAALIGSRYVGLGLIKPDVEWHSYEIGEATHVRLAITCVDSQFSEALDAEIRLSLSKQGIGSDRVFTRSQSADAQNKKAFFMTEWDGYLIEP